jgi:hypothetical protein
MKTKVFTKKKRATKSPTSKQRYNTKNPKIRKGGINPPPINIADGLNGNKHITVNYIDRTRETYFPATIIRTKEDKLWLSFFNKILCLKEVKDYKIRYKSS